MCVSSCHRFRRYSQCVVLFERARVFLYILSNYIFSAPFCVFVHLALTAHTTCSNGCVLKWVLRFIVSLHLHFYTMFQVKISFICTTIYCRRRNGMFFSLSLSSVSAYRFATRVYSLHSEPLSLAYLSVSFLLFILIPFCYSKTSSVRFPSFVAYFRGWCRCKSERKITVEKKNTEGRKNGRKKSSTRTIKWDPPFAHGHTF